MDQEIKKKWIDALRSGKYKQGFGGLKNLNNEFCCLGVLCDIIDDSKWTLSGINAIEGFYLYGTFTDVLSDEIVDIASMKSFNPMIQHKQLTIWNDENKKNFNEIADLIEESDL